MPSYQPLTFHTDGGDRIGVATGGVLEFLKSTTDSSQVTSALLIGGGSSTVPLTTSTADKNFIGLWTDSTATSGDSRGAYLRHFFSGAGGSGDALRAYGTVNNVTAATGGTVNGAHVSLSVTGASGKISGAANALRCTLDFASTPTTVGGTCAVLLVDSNIATGPTIPANTAFIRFGDVGDQKLDYLFRFDSPSTKLAVTLTANTTKMTKALKIVVDGTAWYLPLQSAVS